MKNKTVFKRVIAVIGRSKLLLFLSLILSVASVILSLYIPVLAGRAIDGIKLSGREASASQNFCSEAQRNARRTGTSYFVCTAFLFINR